MCCYPRNFINKVLTKIRNKQRINKSNEQPSEQSKRMVTLPYINGTSEMTARLLRPFNIDVAHKPSRKLRSYFTKHKDKTAITETNNAIYMIPCGDCSQRYIGQTSKKIETRITEHKKRYKTTRSQITTSNTHIRQLSHFQLGKNTITRTSTNEIRTRI